MFGMRGTECPGHRRYDGFFLIGMAYMSLRLYYMLNFNFHIYHRFNIETIENWIPWERIVYQELLRQYLEEQKQIRENNK